MNCRRDAITHRTGRGVVGTTIGHRSEGRLSLALPSIIAAAIAVAVPSFRSVDAGETDEQRSRDAAVFDQVRSGVGRVGFREQEGAITWLGTAFLVSSECEFLTADHVVASLDEGKKLVIRMQARPTYDKYHQFPVVVARRLQSSDLAFLETTVADSECKEALERHSVLKLRRVVRRGVIAGEEILVAGYGNLKAAERYNPEAKTAYNFDFPLVLYGHLSASEMVYNGVPRLLLDIVGLPGLSGSPVVLLSTGEVVGVVRGPERFRRELGLYWAIYVTSAVLEPPDESDQ